jgi:hypothetical protein
MVYHFAFSGQRWERLVPLIVNAVASQMVIVMQRTSLLIQCT